MTSHNGMPPDEMRDIEIFQLKQDMIRLQAQLDRLENAAEDEDFEQQLRRGGPEPVRYVNIGSGIDGFKDGDVLNISSRAGTGDDYHFKIKTNVGADASTVSGVQVVNGYWTRNATDKPNSGHGAGNDGTTEKRHKLTTSAVSALADMDDISGRNSNGDNYVILQLTPDIGSISIGETDPSLEPDGLEVILTNKTTYDSAPLNENGYGQNSHRILGTVTLSSDLVTAYDQWYFGGDIDDTCILPDTESNAFQDAGVPTDETIAESLEFNNRGELQVRGMDDPSTHSISAPEYLVCTDLNGGLGTKPRIAYITPSSLYGDSPPSWCDIQNKEPLVDSDCINSIVDDIVDEINSRDGTSGANAESVEHDKLAFVSASRDENAYADASQDGRYIKCDTPATATNANDRDVTLTADLESANMNVTGQYNVDGTLVVKETKSGWSTPTGTATRTAFDTTTVTTEQLAERVKAIIDDLYSHHGLFGA